MADSSVLVPFILSFEGGFVNHPKDPGGPTNRGITIATFRSVFGALSSVDDLKKMSHEQWHHVFKSKYWDRWLADLIESQSVANLLVDWVWASGAHGIKRPQEILGFRGSDVDGIVGPRTIAALNAAIRDRGARDVFDKLFARRMLFIKSCAHFDVFGRGWLRRLNSIRLGELAYNTVPPKVIKHPV